MFVNTYIRMCIENYDNDHNTQTILDDDDTNSQK